MKQGNGPDTRCLGGKNQILNLMTNHYSALVNIKSTMNTRAPPLCKPKRPQTVKNVPGILTSEQWQEQRETFKRCQNITAEVDHFPSKAYLELRDKLARNKAVKVGGFADKEH